LFFPQGYIKKECGSIAIYHFSVQTISRGNGRSAVACAAYRCGETLYDHRQQKVYQFSKRPIQPQCTILAPSYAPKWIYGRERLWNEVESSEKRVNSRLAREINISLPRELLPDQQKELALTYVQELFVKQGMVADIAIHRDNSHNPHFHVMLTTREISHEGFTHKNRHWDKKETLEKWREQWAQSMNKALERAGFKERVDHRSFEKQGIPRLPTIYLRLFDQKREESEMKKAKKEGREYQPITKYGKINAQIKRINKEIKGLSSGPFPLKIKRIKQESDLLFSLQKLKQWDHLSTQEKEAMLYVRRRMKQNVDLSVAYKCRESLHRWQDAILKKETEIKHEIANLNRVKQIFKEYQSCEQGTISRDRAEIHLTRFGFIPTQFEKDFVERKKQLTEQMESIKRQTIPLKEGLEKISTAIQTLERIVLEEAKNIYLNDHQVLEKYGSKEVYYLVEEFKKTGQMVSVKDIDSFLQLKKDRRQEPKPLIVQYRHLEKEGQFLMNWSQKLEQREKEALQFKVNYPKDYKRLQMEITQERQVLAERLKKNKTKLTSLEENMAIELKQLYSLDQLCNLDQKTIRKIFMANHQEGRTIPIQEMLERESDRDGIYIPFKKVTSEQLVYEIGHSLRLFIESRERNSDLNRAAEEQKRKSRVRN
jgi:hypothetical protein